LKDLKLGSSPSTI